MVDSNKVISEFKSGKSIRIIAREFKVADNVISSIIRNVGFPSNKWVLKVIMTLIL